MRRMMRGLISTALFATQVLAQSSSSDAHSGFHAAVGMGAGSLTLSGNGPTTSGSIGPALMLRFGGAIQPGLVLSGELTGWSKQNLFASWATAVLQWYPQPAGGFYVKGGADVATIMASESVTGTSCCVGGPQH